MWGLPMGEAGRGWAVWVQLTVAAQSSWGHWGGAALGTGHLPVFVHVWGWELSHGVGTALWHPWLGKAGLWGLGGWSFFWDDAVGLVAPGGWLGVPSCQQVDGGGLCRGCHTMGLGDST